MTSDNRGSQITESVVPDFVLLRVTGDIEALSRYDEATSDDIQGEEGGGGEARARIPPDLGVRLFLL